MFQITEGRQVFLVAAFVTITFSIPALATDEYMNNHRNDMDVPARCRSTQIEHFMEQDLSFFTFGIRGARKRGFDMEFPLQRNEARHLHEIYKNMKANGGHPGKLGRYSARVRELFTLMEKHRHNMDFNMTVEGEVLELLAIISLREQLSQDYFVTGAISYHPSGGGNIIGELDLIVGDKSNCEISMVGEVKLGLKGLRKAKRQLNRFRNFLMDIHQNKSYSQAEIVKWPLKEMFRAVMMENRIESESSAAANH